jgi:anti-anti-sigma factor
MNANCARVVVFAPSRLDFLTAPFLAQDLEAKIQEGASIVLDFTKTQSIDPAVTDVLIDGFIKSKQRQARLSLKGVKPQVKLVLEMAGILQHFRPTSTKQVLS